MGRLEEDIVGLLYALGLYRSMASFSSKNTILFLFHIFSLFLRIQSYPQQEKQENFPPPVGAARNFQESLSRRIVVAMLASHQGRNLTKSTNQKDSPTRRKRLLASRRKAARGVVNFQSHLGGETADR